MVRVNLKILRGLIIALLVILLTANSNIITKAATVNELKAYLGIAVESNTSTNNKSTGNKPDTSEKNDVPTNKQDNIVELRAKYKNIQNTLNSMVKQNASTYDILGVVNAAREAKTQLDEAERLKNILSDINSVEFDKSNYVYAIESNTNSAYGDSDYDIGSFGNYSISPVKGMLKIARPYGYRVDSKGKIIESNNCLDLEAPAGKEIVSQWNGIVYSVRSDSTNGNTIIVSHGKGMFTGYYHITDVKVASGKKIRQGQLLGYAQDTSKIETTISNHIGFELLIDSKFKNPLLIFGDNGKDLLSEWQESTSDIFVVADGERYYYTQDMSINHVESSVNTGNNNVSLAEGYNKPDPGVLR